MLKARSLEGEFGFIVDPPERQRHAAAPVIPSNGTLMFIFQFDITDFRLILRCRLPKDRGQGDRDVDEP